MKTRLLHEAKRGVIWPIKGADMNLAHWLERTATATPDAPALFLGRDCQANYRQFYDQAQAIAGWLAAQGVGPADRVAIFMKNVPEYLTVFYGIWCLGAVVVPINAKLHAREAVFIHPERRSQSHVCIPRFDPRVERRGCAGYRDWCAGH